MKRPGPVVFFVAFFLLFGRVEGLLAGQLSALPSPPQNKTNAEGASLKVCLRLLDDVVFVGRATVQLKPGEGEAIVGQLSDTQGDFLFSALKPGPYSVDVTAPGYVEAQLTTQVEAGHGQRTLIVVMEPSPAPGSSTAAIPAVPLRKSEAKKEAKAERDYWVAHELEQNVPPVDPNVACSNQEVLKGVGQRMVEFVGNLEKFTATERVDHYTVDAGKTQGVPQTRKFDYMVTVRQNMVGTFLMDEFRDGLENAQGFPENIATHGLPSLALLFHPVLASDFQFVCEGLGQWGGRTAWQVHFVQRPEKPVRMRAYVINGKAYGVQLEGRAWIDPGNYQVLRLESELAKPIPEIGLSKEHIAIEYAPAQLRDLKLQIWLPREAEMYVEKRKHQYYRTHTFSNFKIFNVDTAEHIQAPKQSYSFTNLSDQDVKGILTVVPKTGARREEVTLKFTVPARGRVFKTVGAGKDVNLEVTEVSSATFQHNGGDGAIKVDADLAKGTTLDVISESALSN